MVWFISLIAFIVYWRKKVNAKKAAGENYANDENYNNVSKIKRLIGIVCLVSFVIGAAIPESPEAKSERQAKEQQQKIERAAKAEQKAAEQVQKAAEQKAAEEANKYVETNIDVLINDVENNAAAANKNYKGKFVKIVGGILDHIESDGDYISISNGDMTLLHVQCFPQNKEVKEQMLNLSNGQRVTVYGKITRVGGIVGYSLDMDKVE